MGCLVAIAILVIAWNLPDDSGCVFPVLFLLAFLVACSDDR